MRKQIISFTIVFSVFLSGCSLGGSKFKKAEKKMVEAAEKCCDAAEMTTKQKRNAIKKSLRVADTTFGDGAYVRLTPDDLEDMPYVDEMFGSRKIKNKNMTMFGKVDGEIDELYAMVIETEDEDFAQSLYDTYYESLGLDSMRKMIREAHEAEIGYNDEEDDRYSCIVSVEGHISASYLRIDGKIVTFVHFAGAEDGDLIDEFYEFMREADYEDMEVLLKGE